MLKNVILLISLLFMSLPAIGGDSDSTAAEAIQQSIVKFQIAEDVSIEDAIDSMQLRANMLNFKQVADLPLSEQVSAMGEEANYMRILAFCDALIAKKMVEFDPIFAGFLPCRIAVIEDENGAGMDNHHEYGHDVEYR